MDKITLSEKAEEEMSEAIKVMAVSAFTEKSQNLIPLEYVAALVGCKYQRTANVIVKDPTFPKGVRLSEKSHARWIAGEKLSVGVELTPNASNNLSNFPPLALFSYMV